MAKKFQKITNKRTGGMGAFGQVDPTGVKSTETYLDLLTIRPDPGQPRQLLPQEMQKRIEGGEAPAVVLRAWEQYAKNTSIGFQKERYASVVELAESIEDAGLINAIQVREVEGQKGIRYRIVTGERRWWAFVLLHASGRSFPAGDREIPAAKIRATIILPEAPTAAMQYRENRDRADVSAIEEARALAAYRDELKARGQKASARAMAKQLEMSDSMVSRFLRLLKLPEAVKQLAHDYGLSEAQLRPIEEQRDDPALQLKMTRQVITLIEESGSATRQQIRQMVKDKAAQTRQRKKKQEGRGKAKQNEDTLLADVQEVVQWLTEAEPALLARLDAQHDDLLLTLEQLEGIVKRLLYVEENR